MFFIAIVNYNKVITDITPADAVRKFLSDYGSEKVRAVIVDNSDDPEIISKNNKLFKDSSSYASLSDDSIAFISVGKNEGLSSAYNRAYGYCLNSHIKENNDLEKNALENNDLEKNPLDNDKKFRDNWMYNSFMLIMDDDTDFSYDYIKSIYEKCNSSFVNENRISVVAGIVESAGTVMSPMKGFRNRFKSSDFISSPGIYENVCCISSGMAVRLESVKRTGGFEKSLFLDMIDFTFFYRLSENKLNRVLVLDTKIVQNFSGRQNVDRKSSLRRFKVYKKDFKQFCRLTERSRAFCFIHLLKRRVAISIKTK